MLIFTGIVVSAVLGLIVYGLHRYQSMEVEYSVDRTMPLPPLKEGISAINLSTIDKANNESLAPDSFAGRESISPKDPDDSAINPVGNLEQTLATGKYTGNWQERLNQAKQAMDVEYAAQLCEENFPLWGAYNQLCILLRTKLKTATSISNATNSRTEELQLLYRTAAIAELLHDKSEGETRYTLNQIRRMPLRELPSLDMPYSEIGYAQLRLIRKSDVKLMLEQWGRPTKHCTPREFHREWWNEFSQNQN